MNALTILSDAILTQVSGGCPACGGPSGGTSHPEQFKPGRKRAHSVDQAEYDYGNMIFADAQDSNLP